MEDLIGSLERKLQRPLLAKSRTLPSIPQSPTVARVHHKDLIGGSPPRRKTLASTSLQPCTLPPAGEPWRLEDDGEGEVTGRVCANARPRSQSPFSHFRTRSAYLRKSASVDDQLDMVDYRSPALPAGKGGRGSKGKLKRKFVFYDETQATSSYSVAVLEEPQIDMAVLTTDSRRALHNRTGRCHVVFQMKQLTSAIMRYQTNTIDSLPRPPAPSSSPPAAVIIKINFRSLRSPAFDRPGAHVMLNPVRALNRARPGLLV
ncbi:hypothetical protein DPEC_G00355730 [Dallia pectoralis]|uniref:Uncharacterized protein n=1 Tax=Dallia pectoralis TaxID=75939 RepID=A0ACC2EZK6_DALPE|nr:hypothetical protein DPEC_G00355730 [Dallia pectoralis]